MNFCARAENTAFTTITSATTATVRETASAPNLSLRCFFILSA